MQRDVRSLVLNDVQHDYREAASDASNDLRNDLRNDANTVCSAVGNDGDRSALAEVSA
ncbi:hypothetical protein [Bifidobacterium aquikefiricola]|uniref:Uncharacterized protein n=1 Tax=Bifidobacterium aquikefiricola TaxID=3059038 RepID=A0AB39U7M9_9BIFI